MRAVARCRAGALSHYTIDSTSCCIFTNVRSSRGGKITPNSRQIRAFQTKGSKDAFDLLMSSKGSSPVSSTPPASTKRSRPSPAGWKDALYAYIDHPEQFADYIVENTDTYLVIRDKFPKSRHHLLVIPKERLPTHADLTAAHLPLISSMRDVANKHIERLVSEDPFLSFNVGFHAVPSMNQLHLHVISTDFFSDAMKNKKHFNSFTTEFFISVPKFVSELTRLGTINFDHDYYEELLKGDLVDPVTGRNFGNKFQELKRFLAERDRMTREQRSDDES